MRKIGFVAIAASVALTLTGCSASLKYDKSNWFDDSANHITMDLTNVNVEKGIGGDVQSQFDKLATLKVNDFYINGSTGGLLTGSQILIEKGSAVSISTVPNILSYTSNANNGLMLACKTTPYFFKKDVSVVSLIKTDVKNSVDFSFKLYNRVVLIDNRTENNASFTKIYVVSFNPDNQIETVGIIYSPVQYKDGESFVKYINGIKKDNNGANYSSGYVDWKYTVHPKYNNRSLGLAMLNAHLEDGVPYIVSFNRTDNQYMFNKLSYNPANNTCNQSKN
jgi:hypothetical protein